MGPCLRRDDLFLVMLLDYQANLRSDIRDP